VGPGLHRALADEFLVDACAAEVIAVESIESQKSRQHGQ
jgi:hypothetical protein